MAKSNENKPKRGKKAEAPQQPPAEQPPAEQPTAPAPPPAKKESKAERLRRELKEAEEEEKAEKLKEKNARRKALEEAVEKMFIEDLQKYWVENELKKTPKAEGEGKPKGVKVLCACAVWFPNEEKEKVGRSSYNDVKQCPSEGKIAYTHPITGEACGVCSRHHQELTIKNGKPHHGWFNQPWGFPEEMLGSKVKKEWVCEIWKRYPVYKPTNGDAILKEALKE